MLKELADGVYVETGYESGNVGVVLSSRGALLIDAPLAPSEAEDWRATLRKLQVDQIYGIVNTDFHPEHFLGNAHLGPVRVIGHEQTYRQAAKYKTSLLEQLASSYQDSDPALASYLLHAEVMPPEVAVADRANLYLGEREVQVLALDGHTPASLGVYLPRERVLFAGDNVVANVHPDMAQANSEEWLETLDRIRDLDVEVIVPGEEELVGKAAVARLREYIFELRARVTVLFEAGASRREAVEKVGLADYYQVADDGAARLKRRRREAVERVYAEVRTAQRRR